MNPSQKAGTARPRRAYKKKYTKGDYKMKRIARTEALKVVAKKSESKTLDHNSIAFNIDYNMSTSVFGLMDGLAAGAAQNQRVGESVSPTHVRIRWAVKAADYTNLLRVVVIQDISAGGAPTVSTTFESAGTVNTVLSPFYTGYNRTYKVLFDELYSLVYGGNATESYQLTGDIRIPGKKLRNVDYLPGGTTISASGIYLMFISDSSNLSPPIGQYYARVYYKDI